MKTGLFLAAAILLNPIKSTGQIHCVPRNPLFDLLYSRPGVVQNISIPKGVELLALADGKEPLGTGSILRNETGLYITIDGTGRVYRAGSPKGDSICFTRIDSTIFRGYNSESHQFIHKDTLFSFGGYGFWRVNGHLRYFSDGREWSLAPLDRELPFHGVLSYYDTAKGSLYMVHTPFMHEGTGERIDSHRAMRLDVSERRIRTLGTVGSMSGTKPARFLFSSQTLSGMVIDDYRSILLWDLAANRVWRMDNQGLRNRLFGDSRIKAPILFETAGKLFQYDVNRSRLDSLPISRSDFVPTGESVYVQEAGQGPGVGMLYSVLGVLAFAVMVFAYRRRKAKPSTNGTKSESILTIEEDGDAQEKGTGRSEVGFPDLDRQLVDTIMDCTVSGKTCTVNEVNRVLGVARKSVEVQKKMRRESMIRVNRRFRELSGMDIDLIASRRSEEDRRYYEYHIPAEAMDAYRRISEGKSS